MPSFSQMMFMLAVFGFMTGVVSLMPSLIHTLQARYQSRAERPSRRMDELFTQLNTKHILAIFAMGGLVLGILSHSVIVGLAIALLGIVAPRIIVALWKDFRVTLFESQLLDGLILINNALKSGLDIVTGVELISTNMKAPISEEFALVLNAYRLGTPLEEALQTLTRRIPSRTLETAIGAILIQRETGGNLVKTFEQLIVTIREESKLQKKVRALSAQGRTQIAFLSVFPWGFAALMYFMSPDTMKPALASTTGQLVVVGLVVWEIIGLVVTKRIVTVDV